MKREILVILFIAFLFIYQGCSDSTATLGVDENCTPQFPDQTVTYNNYVKRIVSQNCTITCHKGEGTLGPGNFTTYAGIRAFVALFPFRVIQDRADMPQGNAPLPKSTRDSLNIWVQNCSPED